MGQGAQRNQCSSIPACDADLQVLQESYAPTAEYAFEGDSWLGTYISEVLSFLGSLTLFSIFILITIFWADLLKKVRLLPRPGNPLRPSATLPGAYGGAIDSMIGANPPKAKPGRAGY